MHPCLERGNLLGIVQALLLQDPTTTQDPVPQGLKYLVVPSTS